MTSLAGRVAVVTGGGSGLGAAINPQDPAVAAVLTMPPQTVIPVVTVLPGRETS